MPRKKKISGQWGFVSGLVAAREGRMLSAHFFEQLLGEASLEAMAMRLGESAPAGRLRGLADPADADAALAEWFGQACDEVRRFCPSPVISELVELQQEFANLKSFLKRTLLKQDASQAFPSRYSDQDREDLLAGRASALPAQFAAALDPLRRAIRVAGGRADALDAAVDGLCLAVLGEESGTLASDFLADYYRRYALAKRVEMLWRLRALQAEREMLELILDGFAGRDPFRALSQAEEADWPRILESAMPGLELGAVAAADGRARILAFVRSTDAWLMDYLRRAKSVAFGPERVFGYLLGLEAEYANLRLVLVGRASGLSPELLRARLLACYV